MRNNPLVTQHEYEYPSDMTLVSSTNTQGRIIHCNRAFIEASGFESEKLLGQPHNIVRHPEMAPEAYRDMWRTIGSGMPWTGIVKNRRKNGDYYWVQANVTPIMNRGKPVGHMSVCSKPLSSVSGGTEGRPRRAHTALHSRFMRDSSASTEVRSLRSGSAADTHSSRLM